MQYCEAWPIKVEYLTLVSCNSSFEWQGCDCVITWSAGLMTPQSAMAMLWVSFTMDSSSIITTTTIIILLMRWVAPWLAQVQATFHTHQLYPEHQLCLVMHSCRNWQWRRPIRMMNTVIHLQHIAAPAQLHTSAACITCHLAACSNGVDAPLPSLMVWMETLRLLMGMGTWMSCLTYCGTQMTKPCQNTIPIRAVRYQFHNCPTSRHLGIKVLPTVRARVLWISPLQTTTVLRKSTML